MLMEIQTIESIFELLGTCTLVIIDMEIEVTDDNKFSIRIYFSESF